MSGCSGGACGLPTGVAMARYYQNPFAEGIRAQGDGGAVSARYRGAIGNPDAHVGQAAQASTACPYGFAWALTREGWRCVPIAPAPHPGIAAQTSHALPASRYRLRVRHASGVVVRRFGEPLSLAQVCAVLGGLSPWDASLYADVQTLAVYQGQYVWVPAALSGTVASMYQQLCAPPQLSLPWRG